MARVSNEKAKAHALAQRERILEAAYSCFVEMGFHAAGMAAISARADMSPGLIYRYFPAGKSAIIQGIIEDQLELAEEEIRQVQQFDLPTDLLRGLDKQSDDHRRMNAPLMLELSAMARRDPEIASVVAQFDTRIREAIAASFIRTSTANEPRPVTPDDAGTRALLVQLVFDGMLMRQAREPGFDRERMKRALELVFASYTANANADPASPAP